MKTLKLSNLKFLNLLFSYPRLEGTPAWSCSPHKPLMEFPTYDLKLDELDKAQLQETDEVQP